MFLEIKKFKIAHLIQKLIYLKLIRIQFILIIIAPIVIGIFLALKEDFFSWRLSILLLLTAACLEFIASVANDYGDGIRGIDGKNRIGPERIFGLGKISAKAIKTIIVIAVIFCIFLGTLLLFFVFKTIASFYFGVWIFIGVVCLWAALKYSLGTTPHSKTGLGDISIFIFEGPVGVIGSYFLLTYSYNHFLLLESVAIGTLAVSALNLNNIRDIESDKKGGRETIAVRLGEKKAKLYQKIVLIGSLFFFILAASYRFSYWYQWLFILCYLPLIKINFSLGSIRKEYNSFHTRHCFFIFLISLFYGVALVFPEKILPLIVF